MKTKTLFISLIAFVLFSCNQGNKEAIKEYQECMLTLLSDDLLSIELINERHKMCLDSILIKYDLKENHEFLANFDFLPEIKETREKLINLLIINVNKLLQNNQWGYENIGLNWRNNEVARLDFDGTMFKLDFYAMTGIMLEWAIDETFTGRYRIEVEDNRIYVVLVNSGEESLMRLRKNNQGRFYLDGEYRFWQEQ